MNINYSVTNCHSILWVSYRKPQFLSNWTLHRNDLLFVSKQPKQESLILKPTNVSTLAKSKRDFHSHQLEQRKLQETRFHTHPHVWGMCHGIPVCYLPLPCSCSISPSVLLLKVPAQYWAVNVRDSEHNYLILDTNGNDSTASLLSMIFSAGFCILQVIKFPSDAYIRKEKGVKSIM